jgi:hypothetical protein
MPPIETNWVKLFGKHLRRESEESTRDELPRRWIDLIQALDERERKRDVRAAEDRNEGRDKR